MTSNVAAGDVTGGMFAAIDAKDTEAFVAYLSDDAVFRFGSAPAVQGRAAIQQAVDQFFGTIAGSKHTIAKSLCEGPTRVVEGEVTYTRLDDSQVTLPFTDVFKYDGKLIAEYKIYMDVNPLYAE